MLWSMRGPMQGFVQGLGQGLPHMMNEGNVERVLPAHDHFTKGFMFLPSKWLCQDIGPVVIGVYFDNFDVAVSNLIFKVMPF